MLQQKMSPLGSLTLVWIIMCQCFIASEFAAAPGRHCNYRETCGKVLFDTREAVCCKNQLHQGAGLECCGEQPFNPLTATCCKTESGLRANVTQGLSTKVSLCCGLKAYSKLNELCCNFTIIPKPVPAAKCCGEVTIDEATQLCCGPQNDSKVHNRSSTYDRCCYKDMFDNRTQCCCEETNDSLEIKPKNGTCCQSRSGPSKLQANDSNMHASKRSISQQKCPNVTVNVATQLCCGDSADKRVHSRNSTDHLCCGKEVFDSKTQCCCDGTNDSLEIKPKNGTCCQSQSGPSKPQANDSNMHASKRSISQQKCHNVTVNEATQLCCGDSADKRVHSRNSTDHLCCGKEVFDSKTQCCCEETNDSLKIKPKNGTCCQSQSGVEQKSLPPSSMSCKPQASAHGPVHWDKSCFCKGKWRSSHLCGLGQCDAVFTVSNPCTHVCCDGCVSKWKPGIDQCCGNTQHGLAEPGVLCSDNLPCTVTKEGEECADMGILYDPAKATMCCSQLYGSPGQHCCGTELVRPRIEICCSGHRHEKAENAYCCGIKSYNIKDPHMKCCSGTLYNLTSLATTGQDAQCCGSSLLTPQDQMVCCSDHRWQLLHAAKNGFRCCGHLYYNTSLYTCCEGKVHPINSTKHHQSTTIQGSTLLSVNNLNKSELCKGIHTGIVESVSLHSVVFNNVLKIHGGNGSVTAVPLPQIFNISDSCNFPKLILGTIYFFNEVNVYTDFNHCSVYQSLYFIFSKCYDT